MRSRMRISDLAVMIATKVVGKDLNTQDHEQLIQEFIDGAGDCHGRNSSTKIRRFSI